MLFLFIAVCLFSCQSKVLFKCDSISKEISKYAEFSSGNDYLWKADLVILNDLIEKNKECLMGLTSAELLKVFGKMEQGKISNSEYYIFCALNYLGTYDGEEDERTGLYIVFMKNTETGETERINIEQNKVILRTIEGEPSH